MGIFNFFKSKETIQANNPTKREPRRPKETDWTDSYTANHELTHGLYHNTYPGFKLAGGLAFAPIAIPIWLMGMPIPSPVDKKDTKTQEELQEITEVLKKEFDKISLECHLDGTVWVFPKWSTKENKIVLEYIIDDSVTDIITDVETGKIIEIITDENLKIRTGYNKTAFVRRTRYFTRSRIDIVWSGGKTDVPNELKNKSMRNPLGILPIPFTNNKDVNQTRGHSDYERAITDLKDYHDIDLARSNMLAKFKTKMVQGVVNVDEWLSNNAFDSINDIDISQIDMIFNLKDQETTDFAYPERAHEAYNQTLKQKFQKLVEEFAVAEIAWGLKSEGNNASVEESMGVLIMYVHDKQNQKTDAFKQLYSDCLKISRYVNFNKNVTPITVSWDNLDALSDRSKAEIFEKFASGIANLTKSAGFTKEILHNLWCMMYPKAVDEDLDKFIVGLSDMGGHVQWTNESYTNALDFQSGEENQEKETE